MIEIHNMNSINAGKTGTYTKDKDASPFKRRFTEDPKLTPSINLVDFGKTPENKENISQHLDKTSVISNPLKSLIKPSTTTKNSNSESLNQYNVEQLPSNFNKGIQDQFKEKNIDFENKRKSTPASHALIGLTERSSTKYRSSDSELIRSTLKKDQSASSDFETIQSSTLNNSRLSLSKEYKESDNSFSAMSAVDEMDSIVSSATNYSNQIGGIRVTKNKSFIIKVVVSILMAVFFYVMMSAFGKGFWTLNPSTNHIHSDLISQKLPSADLSAQSTTQNTYSQVDYIKFH